MFGHMSDVGGKVPASMPTDARTIFEEGVVIPPFRLYKKGVLDDDALRIILNQVRKPDWNRADLNGIVAACRTAARRVQELCDRFGVDTYNSALEALLDRNYRAMKTLLAMMFEEGRTLSFTDYICDDGLGYGPYELKLRLTRTGDKVLLDFTGSSPQAQGPINYYINENLVRMFFGIYMITVVDPQILWNDGFYPLVDVEIPEDSFWKPRYPAALNARNHGIGRVFDLFGGLLGQTNPDLLNAAGFSSSPHFMYSGHLRRAATARASGSSSTPSASAASPAARSATGRTATPCGPRSSTSRASTSSPTTRCASSAGRPWPTREVRGCTAAATASTSPTASSSRAPSPSTTTGGSPTPGASTAASPARAAASGSSVPTAPRRSWAARSTTCPWSAGDLLHFVTWGGGGWGDPLARDPDLVGLEVRRGLVTADGARRYGVVCDESGARRRVRDGDAARARWTPTGPTRCRPSTWARRWRRSWSAPSRRPACPPRDPRSPGDPAWLTNPSVARCDRATHPRSWPST